MHAMTSSAFTMMIALAIGCQNPRQPGAAVQLESVDRTSICTLESIDISVRRDGDGDHARILVGTRPVSDIAELRRVLAVARNDWATHGIANPVVTLSASND